MSRRGVALATVLWVLAVGGATGTRGALATRAPFDASIYRASRLETVWAALGCASSAFDALATSYSAGLLPRQREALWEAMHLVDLSSATGQYPGCEASVRSAGAGLDPGRTSETGLRRFLEYFAPPWQAESLHHALRDWIDQDDEPRGAGFEAPFYAARDRLGPSNTNLESAEELLLVQGFESRSDIADHIDVAGGPIDLLHAPAPVLSSVPGFSRGVVEVLVARRAAGWRPRDLREIGSFLGVADAAEFISHYVDAERSTALGAPAWILRVTVSPPLPGAPSTEEWRILQGSRGLHIDSRRVW